MGCKMPLQQANGEISAGGGLRFVEDAGDGESWNILSVDPLTV